MTYHTCVLNNAAFVIFYRSVVLLSDGQEDEEFKPKDVGANETEEPKATFISDKKQKQMDEAVLRMNRKYYSFKVDGLDELVFFKELGSPQPKQSQGPKVGSMENKEDHMARLKLEEKQNYYRFLAAHAFYDNTLTDFNKLNEIQFGKTSHVHLAPVGQEMLTLSFPMCVTRTSGLDTGGDHVNEPM